jgi:iron(II)-dependent oxidoreductase
MLKKALVAIAVVVVLSSLNGCGKKETQEEAVSENSKAPIVPGEMVLIPAGEFIMGTNSKDPLDSYATPQHKVNLPAFWIDKYEVTNSQYMEFTSKTGYFGEGEKEGKDWRDYFAPDKVRVPVVSITWKDADAYCKWAGKRLPTEEEWAKAARGPDGNAYPWGNEWVDGRSNTAEVGIKDPSDIGQFDDVSYYGVYDMLGNVQEWTASWFAPYKGNTLKFPAGYRAVRGLSARYPGKKGHLWNRSGFPSNSTWDTGFRCVKDATPEEAAKAAK